MGPIMPVNDGSAGGVSGPQPGQIIGGPGSAAGVSSGRSAETVGGAAGLDARDSINSSVSQLLQSVGGGLENDQLLKLLIAALILMALLQQQQESTAGLENLTRQGAGGAGGTGDSQFIGIYSSSTTISIQQSTTSVFLGTGADLFGSAGGPSETTGGQLDLLG